MRGLRAAIAAITLCVACLETLEPLPLETTIQASRAVVVIGDTIDFLVTAQGGQLVGIEIVYGDVARDLFVTNGARTASVTFRHAFTTPGVYQVRATTTDALAGTKDASVDVRVN